MTTVQSTRLRLARYYFGLLNKANRSYRYNYHNIADGLALIDQEWPQIKQWQDWATAHNLHSRDLAQMYVDYLRSDNDILLLRQPAQERIVWLRSGLDAARAVGDRRAELTSLIRLAWAVHKQSRLEEAQSIAAEAFALAETLGDPVYIGQSYHLLGEIAHRIGEYARAENAHTQGIAYLEPLGPHVTLAELYFSMSELANIRGDFATARDDALRSIAIFAALGRHNGITNIQTWLGVMTWEAGDTAEGERIVRQSIERNGQLGFRGTQAHGMYALGQILAARGETAEAAALFEEGMQIARDNGDEWLVRIFVIEQGGLDLRAGDAAAARLKYQRAVDSAREAHYGSIMSQALINLADACIALGHQDEARDALLAGMDGVTGDYNYLTTTHICLTGARLWKTFRDPVLAAEWACMLRGLPNTDRALKADAAALCAELEAALGQDVFAAAANRGQALAPETVARTIRQELSSV